MLNVEVYILCRPLTLLHPEILRFCFPSTTSCLGSNRSFYLNLVYCSFTFDILIHDSFLRRRSTSFSHSGHYLVVTIIHWNCTILILPWDGDTREKFLLYWDQSSTLFLCLKLTSWKTFYRLVMKSYDSSSSFCSDSLTVWILLGFLYTSDL